MFKKIYDVFCKNFPLIQQTEATPKVFIFIFIFQQPHINQKVYCIKNEEENLFLVAWATLGIENSQRNKETNWHLRKYVWVWFFMISYGPVCSCMVPYGPVRSSMVPYGPLWSRMVLYGPIWSPWSRIVPMVPYCPVWSRMVPYGPEWSRLVLFGPHVISDNYRS